MVKKLFSFILILSFVLMRMINFNLLEEYNFMDSFIFIFFLVSISIFSILKFLSILIFIELVKLFFYFYYFQIFFQLVHYNYCKNLDTLNYQYLIEYYEISFVKIYRFLIYHMACFVFYVNLFFLILLILNAFIDFFSNLLILNQIVIARHVFILFSIEFFILNFLCNHFIRFIMIIIVNYSIKKL